MQRKILLLSFALLQACATRLPDVPICVEVTMSRASCTKVISGESFEINDEKLFEKKSYWDLKPTMLLLPASSWRQIKTYIITSCKRYGNCNDEVSSWDRILETIERQVESKE
jgi:hypothetical protein